MLLCRPRAGRQAQNPVVCVIQTTVRVVECVLETEGLYVTDVFVCAIETDSVVRQTTILRNQSTRAAKSLACNALELLTNDAYSACF